MKINYFIEADDKQRVNLLFVVQYYPLDKDIIVLELEDEVITKTLPNEQKRDRYLQFLDSILAPAPQKEEPKKEDNKPPFFFKNFSLN